MSYSCTSTGNSQDPSSSKKSGVVNPGSCSGGGDTGNGNNSHSVRGGRANSKPDLTEAMKVKKGCNATDVGVPVTTEEELLANKTITPEDVLGLQKITESKCPRVRIAFGIFRITSGSIQRDSIGCYVGG